MTMLFLLLWWHALADFPLQGEWLAKHKAANIQRELWSQGERETVWTRNPLWPWALGAHAMIHAGGVALITSNIWLGLFELLAHATIDYLKCRNKLTFGQDQLLHIGCKVLYTLV